MNPPVSPIETLIRDVETNLEAGNAPATLQERQRLLRELRSSISSGSVHQIQNPAEKQRVIDRLNALRSQASTHAIIETRQDLRELEHSMNQQQLPSNTSAVPESVRPVANVGSGIFNRMTAFVRDNPGTSMVALGGITLLSALTAGSRRVGRAIRTGFRWLLQATGLATLGYLGYRYFNGERAEAGPAATPEATKILEALNKTGTAVNFGDDRLQNINLLALTAPLRLNGNNVQFLRNGSGAARIRINGNRMYENPILSRISVNDMQVVNINNNRYLRVTVNIAGLTQTGYLLESDAGALTDSLAAAATVPDGQPNTSVRSNLRIFLLRPGANTARPGTSDFPVGGSIFGEQTYPDQQFNRVTV